jgi:hypothetical protein
VTGSLGASDLAMTNAEQIGDDQHRANTEQTSKNTKTAKTQGKTDPKPNIINIIGR